MMTEKYVQRVSVAETEEVTVVCVQVNKYMRSYINSTVPNSRTGLGVTSEDFIPVRGGKLYHNTSK